MALGDPAADSFWRRFVVHEYSFVAVPSSPVSILSGVPIEVLDTEGKPFTFVAAPAAGTLTLGTRRHERDEPGETGAVTAAVAARS